MAVTDLETLIHDALFLVEETFSSHSGVEVQVDLPQSRRSLVCDHQGITQVLVILLHNAFEALQSRGGAIQVKIGSVDDVFGEENAVMSSGSQGFDKAVTFSVTDNGLGIAPHMRDRLFEPFTTTKNGQNARGTGLFIARSIVREHRGRILGQNNEKPSQGATFTFVLPRRRLISFQ